MHRQHSDIQKTHSHGYLHCCLELATPGAMFACKCSAVIIVLQHRMKREFIIPWCIFPINDKAKYTGLYYDVFEEVCIHFIQTDVLDWGCAPLGHCLDLSRACSLSVVGRVPPSNLQQQPQPAQVVGDQGACLPYHADRDLCMSSLW